MHIALNITIYFITILPDVLYLSCIYMVLANAMHA